MTERYLAVACSAKRGEVSRLRIAMVEAVRVLGAR